MKWHVFMRQRLVLIFNVYLEQLIFSCVLLTVSTDIVFSKTHDNKGM